MNVLFANPRCINVFESFGMVFPPLGLLYVAAAVEKHGYKVSLEDFAVSGNKPSNFNYSAYDVVGITTDARRFQEALKISIKARAQGCIVIMGGTQAAFIDEEVLLNNKADYIVRGEGEVTVPELLSTIKSGGQLSEVKGISYMENGEIKRNAPRELIEDLDSLPYPARHLVNIEKYKQVGLKYGGKRSVAVLSTSRGCPHQCSFCVTPQMYGKKWRARSAESVVAEIEYLYNEYGYRAIAFSDDNFTVSPKRVKEICALIIEKKLDIWWWGLSTAENLLKNEDMVSAMAQAGAKTIYIGVESPDPESLKAFNKRIREDTPSRAVALLRKNGLQTFASYILGGVNDDWKTVLRTIKFARNLDTEVAQFTILTPYPGTGLFHEMESSLRHKKWNLYDGIHLVFRHKNIPYVAMELLLIFAYVSYYARGWRAIKGFFKVVINNLPFFKLLHGRS